MRRFLFSTISVAIVENSNTITRKLLKRQHNHKLRERVQDRIGHRIGGLFRIHRYVGCGLVNG